MVLHIGISVGLIPTVITLSHLNTKLLVMALLVKLTSTQDSLMLMELHLTLIVTVSGKCLQFTLTKKKLKMKTTTRGNIVVEEIKVGDIHFEFSGKWCIKSEVLTEPKLDGAGVYHWKSKNLTNGEEFEYMVNSLYPHYSMKLYDHEAYTGCTLV